MPTISSASSGSSFMGLRTIGRRRPDFFWRRQLCAFRTRVRDWANPISEKFLPPYPGKILPKDQDSFNFYLSQLRVKIEQSFGILVPTCGILRRPLSVGFAGRNGLIVALFHLHNFCRDVQTKMVAAEEDYHDRKRGESCWPRAGSAACVQETQATVGGVPPFSLVCLTRSHE